MTNLLVKITVMLIRYLGSKNTFVDEFLDKVDDTTLEHYGNKIGNYLEAKIKKD